MKRLAALLAVVVLGAAACSYGGTPLEPAALTLDGTSVPLSQVEDELAYLADNPDVAQALVGVPVTNTTNEAYNPAAGARLLSLHVQTLLLADALADAGGSVSSADRQAAEAQLPAAFAPADPTTGQPGEPDPSVLDGMPDALRDTLVDFLANQSALAAQLQGAAGIEISDEEIQATFDGARDQLVEACISHVLAAFSDDPADLQDPTFTPSPEAEADAQARIDDVVERLAAGEDFAAVATEVSDDTGSAATGGDLGCSNPAQFVPEFADFALTQQVGEVGPPVRTQFGFHVILVTERTEPELADYEDAIRAQLQ